MWVTHTTVMGFDFIVITPLLLCHCGFSFVFECGVSFLVSSSVFLLMIVQQLVVIPVLSQEGVSACPSTLPSWTNLNFQFLSSELDYIERLANLWFAHIKHFALCRKWSFYQFVEDMIDLQAQKKWTSIKLTVSYLERSKIQNYI